MVAHPNLCISRIDNPSTHGWLVRVTRENTKVVKFFADAKVGGKRLAQEAAKIFRDQTVERFTREGKTPRAKKLTVRSKSNKTGHIGISRVSKKNAKGEFVPYFAVTWRPQPGVSKATTVSIARYGETGALKHAVAIRNRALMRRYGSGVFRKIKAMQDAEGNK